MCSLHIVSIRADLCCLSSALEWSGFFGWIMQNFNLHNHVCSAELNFMHNAISQHAPDFNLRSSTITKTSKPIWFQPCMYSFVFLCFVANVHLWMKEGKAIDLICAPAVMQKGKWVSREDGRNSAASSSEVCSLLNSTELMERNCWVLIDSGAEGFLLVHKGSWSDVWFNASITCCCVLILGVFYWYMKEADQTSAHCVKDIDQTEY
jgi:hypothetical protein